MVDNADNNPILKEIQNTSLFIKQSEAIQKQIQKSKTVKIEEEEELPRFGASQSKLNGGEIDELDDMVGKLLNVDVKEEDTGGKQMMSNDDSFQNIQPAEDGETKNPTSDQDLKKSSSNIGNVSIKEPSLGTKTEKSSKTTLDTKKEKKKTELEKRRTIKPFTKQ